MLHNCSLSPQKMFLEDVAHNTLSVSSFRS